MNNMGLSDSSVEMLLRFFDSDDEQDFIWTVGLYVILARVMSKHKKHHRADAQKRIDKAKKAFAALTDKDIAFLDMRIEEHVNGDIIDYKKNPSCENMLLALNSSVPSSRASVSRRSLGIFAAVAVEKEWIDVSVDNSCLIAVIKIMMKEAGVKHDASAIAHNAVNSL